MAFEIPRLFFCFLLLAPTLCAATLKYPREVERWQEVHIPLVLSKGGLAARFSAANHSRHTWEVFIERGRVCARLTSDEPPQPRIIPEFNPEGGPLSSSGPLGAQTSFARVENGWLVGFNRGEFGAALHWFSPDGKRRYQVSNHQVVGFFSWRGGLHAIEGLAHRHMARGSVIRLVPSSTNGRWRAVTITRLPSAPDAVSVRRDGSLLVTLSDSLVQVDAWGEIATLLPDPAWRRGLYPGSSVLSSDEQKLYIGMRQFVGEFDLSTRKLRLLIPSPAFLNQLSREEEQRIRRIYDRRSGNRGAP